jgi:hypothetical protein
MMTSDMRMAAALLVALLAGCAASPPVQVGADSDTRAARAQLREAAAAGPVRLELNALPRGSDGTLTEARAAEQAARGIKGLDVRFAGKPEATGPARLLLLFDPPAGTRPTVACNAGALPEPLADAGPTRLRAVFCNGGAFVADASATTEGRSLADLDRLIWRTTGRLFPDDYPETYGFDLFGRRVSLGGYIGL